MKRADGRHAEEGAVVRGWVRASAVLMAGWCLHVAAQAQSTLYKCPTGNGYTWSDRPCAEQGRASIQAYGPVEPRMPLLGGTSTSPTLKRAPEHQAYLGARCADLNDALRTAPSRGIKGQTLQDLQDTYRRECAEDEQAAYQQLHRARNEQRELRKAREMADQAQRDAQRIEREQCDEMARILHVRRQKLDQLNDGQRADLQRFQDSYAQRCRG